MAPDAPNLMALLNMAPSAFAASGEPPRASGDMARLPAIKSLSALREEVKRHFGKLPGQELEALVGWFNRNFFRLER